MKLRYKIIKFGENNLSYKGYNYPIEMLKFKKIKFLDILINIPENPKKFLEKTYGKDWEIPNKNYVWYEEAKNLIDIKK